MKYQVEKLNHCKRKDIWLASYSSSSTYTSLT